MRWIVSALFIACATHTLAQASVTLSVRVTDWSWAALPGIVVEMAEVENCLEPGKTGGSKQSSTTNRDGLAEFRVSEKKSYRLITSTDGGFEAQTQCVDMGNGSDPRHLQLRVRPDLGLTGNLEILAVPEKRRDGPIARGEFAGASAGPTALAGAIERFHAGAVVVRPADVDARSCGPLGKSPRHGRDGSQRGWPAGLRSVVDVEVHGEGNPVAGQGAARGAVRIRDVCRRRSRRPRARVVRGIRSTSLRQSSSSWRQRASCVTGRQARMSA